LRLLESARLLGDIEPDLVDLMEWSKYLSAGSSHEDNKEPSMNSSPMKGRTGHFDVPSGDPFTFDKLDRKDLAVSITRMLENVEAPFVACVDSPWGTGKTTFLRMCREHMNGQGLKSVYFNAWSTDFAEDPLVAFVGELAAFLNTLTPDSAQQERLTKLKKFGFYLSKRVVPVTAKLVTLGALDLDKENEGLASELAATMSHDLTAAFDVQKSMVESFRNLVQEIVEQLAKGNHVGRLVILVDELDRCRPTYAAEVLERIKHLFDVPNVVFLLALDMDQLCSSIKGIYGADMDARDYLRRFIDVEYRLPEVDNKAYIATVVRDLGIANRMPKGQHVASLVDSFATLSRMFGLSLRAQSQCAARIAIGIHLMEDLEDTDVLFTVALVVLRTAQPEAYRKYVTGRRDAQDVIDILNGLPGGTEFLNTNEGTAVEAFLRYVQPNRNAARDDVRRNRERIGNPPDSASHFANLDRLFGYVSNTGIDLASVVTRIDIGFATSK
jgi:hypothetical protein